MLSWGRHKKFRSKQFFGCEICIWEKSQKNKIILPNSFRAPCEKLEGGDLPPHPKHRVKVRACFLGPLDAVFKFFC